VPKSCKIHKLDSFSKVLKTIETFQEKNETAWYRGCGRASYQLKPTLYRHPSKTNANELHDLEKRIASVFTQRSPPFVPQSFVNEWDRMFFMQHYGIPTRLLDWTESPFVAMYFALTTCQRDANNIVSDDVALWMLDPSSWNQGALSDITFLGGVLDQDQGQVKSYSPSMDLDQRKEMPIMIYGTHNSPRIVAQRGMFALFGKSLEPMETLYQQQSMKSGCLEKIEIPRQCVDSIAHSLFRKGISDSTVYPDLSGLSMELRRTFGF
jgi:hypothetical protein